MKKIDIINSIRELIGEPKSKRIFMRRHEIVASAQLVNIEDAEKYPSRELWGKLCGVKPINACTPDIGEVKSLYDVLSKGEPLTVEKEHVVETSNTRQSEKTIETQQSHLRVSSNLAQPKKKTLDILGLVQNLPQEFKDIVSEVNWNVTENSITIKLK